MRLVPYGRLSIPCGLLFFQLGLLLQINLPKKKPRETLSLSFKIPAGIEDTYLRVGRHDEPPSFLLLVLAADSRCVSHLASVNDADNTSPTELDV